MDTKPKTYSFSLTKVTTEQFAIINECFTDDGEITIEANLRFGADSAKQMLAVFSSFKFVCNEKPFIVVEAGCHFKIEPDSWERMLNAETQELIASKELLQHLAMLTIGTTRGILHAKTNNTEFNKFVLPTINVSKMIQNDSTFELNND